MSAINGREGLGSGLGPRGPQGAQGAQGSQGSSGGPQGPQGASGAQGSQGSQGSQGAGGIVTSHDNSLTVSGSDAVINDTHSNAWTAPQSFFVATFNATETLASTALLAWNAFSVGGALTLTGSTNINSVAMAAIARPSISSSSPITVDSAATLSIGGDPEAFGSVTITNPYSIWVHSGATRLDGDLLVSVGNVVMGNAALATSAVVGFVYSSSCPGSPTGTPNAYPGGVPLVYDTEHGRLYANNGAWRPANNPSVFTSFAIVGNVGSSETALYSYTSPAGQFVNTNDKLAIQFAGEYVSSVNNKRLRLTFSGATIYDTTSLAITAQAGFFIQAYLAMTGTTTAAAVVIVSSSASPAPLAFSVTNLTGVDFTTTNAIELLATGGASNDVLAVMGVMRWESAP